MQCCIRLVRAMKRLGIYVTYDCEKIADDYIGYMLQELRKVVDCLVVVCNYKEIRSGIQNINVYADRVYYRDNTGFDAGAYKYALCCCIGWDEVSAYEELVLLNDSFYGPFYPMSDLFAKMDKMPVDYWGLTKSPAGILMGKYAYDSHIQSYFLVFRKPILEDRRFRNFWESMPYPESFLQAVCVFELECSKLLNECGWKGIALSDLSPHQYPVKANENPYMLYSYELVRYAEIPVLKRKSLDFRFPGFRNALKALKYIEDQGGYNVQLIKKHILRIGQPLHEKAQLDFYRLEEFYHSHTRIYLYGAGILGKNLAEYFDYKGWSFECFLVTGSSGSADRCIAFEEADITEADGIIIAVGTKEAYAEIKDVVKKRCTEKQIYP